MQATEGQTVELQLQARPGSIREGRHWVVEQVRAGGADRDATSVVELLTSELVTNAVKYGPPGGTITVKVGRQGRSIDVQVVDEGKEAPVPRWPGPTEPGGRGLGLVESLADDWGVQMLPRDGKSVWFRVAV